MTHSNVCSSSGDDIFFDSWNKVYVIQPVMWNHSETRLFWITTGRLSLDCEMVASMLAAKNVCNHIRLSWVIMDFQLIILDQF
jgi:hypothetical protein